MFTGTFNLDHSQNAAGRLIGTFANTDGWGNKLVTIFALYTRTVYMTNKLSNIHQDLLVACGLDSEKSGLITYTWICKNCAMVACPPGQLSG